MRTRRRWPLPAAVRLTILALAALLAAVSATPAMARAERPLDDYVAFAQTYWHAPCETITARYSTDPVPGNDKGAGASWVGECRIAIRGGLSDAETCAIVMHEVGHLAGREHSTDPRNMMYPATITTPECQRRYGTIHDLLTEALSRYSEPGIHCAYARRDAWAMVFSCRAGRTRTRMTINYWFEISTRDIRP